MSLYKIHYHDHIESCNQCKIASEKTNPNELLMGDTHKELLKIFEHSCEDGKNILMEFWLTYNQDE